MRAESAHAFFLELQDRITDALETTDGGGAFRTDEWDREGGGGGRSRVIAEGRVFEKGGVNVSFVHGELSDEMIRALPGEGRSFAATGISLVIHPKSPHVPTVHANFRYLERGGGVSWFGGGADLTPWVLYEEDAIHFHRTWKEVCARHAIADHAKLKKWCDTYFFLPHRGETRGIGGIFFDYMGQRVRDEGIDAPFEEAFAFVKDAGGSFLDAYLPIVDRRKAQPFTDAERDWQLHRRGRYVEFNLLYDRGTVFGLKTNGRVESILMSLPSLVRWSYMHEARAGTPEAALIEVLRKPRDWV